MLINTRDMAAPGSSEIVEQLSFSVSKSEADEEFAMEVMSAQLYSDPLKIVCQEYLSNARDAHRSAGKSEIPVKVHLPTTEEPWYEVADEGSGISRESFRNVFMLYFASTKRSNDSLSNKQNGGFGLGAKSAWSYVPEFFVNTVYEGVEYCYHCYRNDKKKRVADLTSVSRIGRDEHDGTKVRINIKPADIALFIGKFRDITFMWGVKPLVTNIPNFYTELPESAILFEDNNVTVFAKNCGVRNSLTAIVDGIPYPIDVRVISSFLTEHENKFCLNAAAYIDCDKLEVDPTPNRENLEYNNRTRDYIINKVKLAYSAVFKIVETKINDSPNYWNACCTWYNDSVIKTLSNIVETPKYNGTPMPVSTANTVSYENTYSRGKDRTSFYQVSFLTRADGNVVPVVTKSNCTHTFHSAFPFVFQIGGAPEKCNDKLVALYNELIKNRELHPIIKSFNLVRIPSQETSTQSVLEALENNYNWSKILKYDLSQVVIPKIKKLRAKNSVIGKFYHVDGEKLIKVNVDFRNCYDVYVPIKNKTVTIMGRSTNIDTSEFLMWKKISGINFSHVKLYAVPERFIKKISKVKTMRSMDEVVQHGIDKLKLHNDFDEVAKKKLRIEQFKKIRYGISNVGTVTEIYEIVSKKINPNSVISQVIDFIKSFDVSGSETTLTDDERTISWYMERVTKVAENNSPSETIDPILLDTQKLFDKFSKMYDPLTKIISLYNGKNDPRCRSTLVDIINMIESKATM